MSITSTRRGRGVFLIVFIVAFAVAFSVVGYLAPLIYYRAVSPSYWLVVTEARIDNGTAEEDFLHLHVTREAKEDLLVDVRLSVYHDGSGETPVWGLTDLGRVMKDGTLEDSFKLPRAKPLTEGTYTAVLGFCFYVEEIGRTRLLTVDVPPFTIGD